MGLNSLVPERFSARSAIFSRYWTCSFSGSNNQAIEAEVVCIARVVLPSRQIHLDESDDEEDDHTDQKADADVFIEFGVSLLPGVNLIEAREDEVN